MVEYLDLNTIQEKRITAAPRYGRNVDGYGRKIPTGAMLRVQNRWRRVYLTQFSNVGSRWIILNGKKKFLRDCFWDISFWED